MPEQLRLPIATSLPAWQSDETLYGWASRFHFRSGFSLPTRTSKALFGNRLAGLRHDFPSGLDELVIRTGGHLGEVQALIDQRTLLPYFLRFRKESEAREACATLRGPLIGGLKFRLGLLTARLRASMPLKACQECIAEDSLEFGGASWRRDHQWPGVWWCLRHDRSLQTCTTKVNGVGRFQYLLPELEQFKAPAELLPGTIEVLRAVAKMAIAFASLPSNAHFDLSKQQHMYLRRLVDLGLTKGTRLRVSEIERSFCEFSRPLANIPELGHVARSQGNRVARLLRLPRGVAHPLRHLVVWAWLFPSPEQVFRSYSEAAELPMPLKEPPKPSAWAGEDRARITALIDSGMSVSAAARKLGVAVRTAQAALAQSGRQPPCRPKKLTQVLRRRLLCMLAKGSDIEKAAAKVGLAQSSVVRILRTTPGLHTNWADVRRIRRRAKARSRWLALIDGQHHGEQAASLRRRLPAEYSWLYRNDRAWLIQATTRRRFAPTPSGVDWSTRDKILVSELADACRRLRKNGAKQIRLYELCREVDGLSPWIPRLHKLPLSQQLLRDNVVQRATRQH